MNKNWMRFVLRKPDGDDGESSGSGGTATAAATTFSTATTSAAAGETGKTGATTAATAATAAATTTTTDGKTEGHVWPDDWRERMVSGVSDEAERAKELKQLQRYASPQDVHKKARALETRLSSGELKSVLPKDASPERLKDWRAENGIPELPTGYDLDLGNGVKFSAEDKSVVDGFLKQAHETNQTPEQVKASLRAFHAHTQTQQQTRHDADVIVRQEADETLREEWGPEFKRNINIIDNLLNTKMDQDTKDLFLSGRLADGTPIGSSPVVLKMLVGLALVDNPAATVVPNAGGNMAQSVDNEIETIEKSMRTNRTEYNKNDKMQARYRELLNARETLQKRAK